MEMSGTYDSEDEDALGRQLSAMVDGELAPIEALALKRAVEQTPALQRECNQLEDLKLAVHAAGRQKSIPPEVGARLRASVETAATERETITRTQRWVLPLGSLAVAAAAVLVLLPGAPKQAPTPTTVANTSVAAPVPLARTAAPPSVEFGTSALSRLVAVHRGELESNALRDMRLSGALRTLERLPASLDPPRQRVQVVRASFNKPACNDVDGSCEDVQSSTTLAVLDANHVDLPQRMLTVLNNDARYDTRIQGTDVTVTVRRGKLFVLMRDVAGPDYSGPI